MTQGTENYQIRVSCYFTDNKGQSLTHCLLLCNQQKKTRRFTGENRSSGDSTKGALIHLPAAVEELPAQEGER